jgi:aminopeptidase
MMNTVLEQNLHDTITLAIKHQPDQRALMVYDDQSPLSRAIADGYRAVLPAMSVLNFAHTTADEIRSAIDQLSPGDLVILVQSSSFRLNEFRFRLELFNRNLAVIEHPHLGRMVGEEHDIYIDSLAYDAEYYQSVGHALKKKIDNARQIIVRCEGTELVYDGPFESAKLNIGDYTGMKNVGGQFPIGEVFTEPASFAKVNGAVKLFAFADASFHVVAPPEPVLIVIENGVIVDAPHAPESFVKVLDQIRADEQLWVRELGFGMNRALTRDRRLVDIGSYERMCGIHLSIGQKHTIYTKEGFPKRSSKYHVDVFADVATVLIDGEVVYEGGSWVVRT